jgi:hypothetical protein
VIIIVLKNKNNKERLKAYKLAIKLRKKGLGRRRIEKELVQRGFARLSKNVQNWIYYKRKPLQIKEIKKSAAILTKEKAYLLGVIGPGDGFIRKNAGICLSVIDKDFVEAFKKVSEQVYGIKASIKLKNPGKTSYGKKQLINVTFYSTRILEDLRRYKVSFSESTWNIPPKIKNAYQSIKCAYISGFADSQGTAHGREIILASKNEKGLDEMLKLILSLGLRATKLKRKDTSVISVHSRSSLEYFYKNIGFQIKRKQSKLGNILAQYKNCKYTTPVSKVDAMVPMMIKLTKAGQSQKEIANYLGISQSVVCRRLQKRRST